MKYISEEELRDMGRELCDRDNGSEELFQLLEDIIAKCKEIHQEEVK